MLEFPYLIIGIIIGLGTVAPAHNLSYLKDGEEDCSSRPAQQKVHETLSPPIIAGRGGMCAYHFSCVGGLSRRSIVV
jgi:hypothetical protein